MGKVRARIDEFVNGYIVCLITTGIGLIEYQCRALNVCICRYLRKVDFDQYGVRRFIGRPGVCVKLRTRYIDALVDVDKRILDGTREIGIRGIAKKHSLRFGITS
ncbi:hypothetical protein DESC_140063 [Desulfosarcina cetonica]|nr:hypothetical protein DESC_140063 [Desulfosarcina cetonica]